MITKRADTWMPLYIGDYIRDTGHLTTIEHGAYFLLIMHAWSHNGLLPENDASLRAIVRMSEREWKRHKATIISLFTKSEDGLHHKRVDVELAKAKTKCAQRSAAGRASATQRKDQRDTNGRWKPVGVPLQRNTIPSPSQESVIAESKIPNPRARVTCEGITPEPGTGRPVCQGWYVDDTRRRIYDAARIDDAKWPGHEGNAITDWLLSGIEPETIVSAIRQSVARQGEKYKCPGTLTYFNIPVRQAHERQQALICEGRN